MTQRLKATLAKTGRTTVAALSILSISAGTALAGGPVGGPVPEATTLKVGGEAPIWFGGETTTAPEALLVHHHRDGKRKWKRWRKKKYYDHGDRSFNDREDRNAVNLHRGNKKKRKYRSRKRFKDYAYYDDHHYYKRKKRRRNEAAAVFGGLLALGAAAAIADSARRHGSYRGACERWADECAHNWGYDNRDFYGCLRYHGC